MPDFGSILVYQDIRTETPKQYVKDKGKTMAISMLTGRQGQNPIFFFCWGGGGGGAGRRALTIVQF